MWSLRDSLSVDPDARINPDPTCALLVASKASIGLVGRNVLDAFSDLRIQLRIAHPGEVTRRPGLDLLRGFAITTIKEGAWDAYAFCAYVDWLKRRCRQHASWKRCVARLAAKTAGH